MSNEIVLYEVNDQSFRIEVTLQDETVWLTQQQIVQLFDSSKANISEHIKNVFATNELQEEATVRKIRTVRREGNREVTRNIIHYSLDVIISVGYRVNSHRGTQFRIWANAVLKEHLLKGYSVNRRIDFLEESVHTLKQEVKQVSLQLNTQLPPKQGIFYNGQVFDAYVFVADIIKSAKKDIVLIDNYINETTLLLLAKRNPKVSCTVYTQNNSKVLQQDIQKHNVQYESITVNLFKKAHDRFLIIDQQTMYHIGASLKDLGKKWFAFSKIELDAKELLTKIGMNL